MLISSKTGKLIYSKLELDALYRQRHWKEIQEKRKAFRHTVEYRQWQKGYQLIYRTKRRGLTEEQFQNLLIIQNFSCAICMEKLIKPQIDHNHITNQTRGILCIKCNTTLGRIENTNFYYKSQQYLQRYENVSILRK